MTPPQPPGSYSPDVFYGCTTKKIVVDFQVQSSWSAVAQTWLRYVQDRQVLTLLFSCDEISISRRDIQWYRSGVHSIVPSSNLSAKGELLINGCWQLLRFGPSGFSILIFLIRPTNNKQSQLLFRQKFLEAAFLCLVFWAELLLRKQMSLPNVAYI